MALGLNKKEDDSNTPPPPAPDDTPFPPGPMSEQYPTSPGQPPGESPSGLPVDQVVNLRQQGLSNNQIVQSLQRDGFDSGQIFDAMNQADLQGGAGSPVQFGQPDPMGPGSPADPMQPGMPPPQMEPVPQEPYPPEGNLPPVEGMPPVPESGDVSRVEEIAEAIIDEKWEELVKSINKILEWKDATETKISKIEQQFKDLKDNFDNLHKAIIGKIGEYDKNILGVGTEIKAMEKVFQKILPTFTENVSELSRITKNMKKTPASKRVPR